MKIGRYGSAEEEWNALHGVRTGLSVVALVIFLFVR